MSVRRKGPRATIVRSLTYVLLVAVAVVIIFPFFIAVSTAFKNNQDIFNYPPTIIPRENVRVDAAEVGVQGAPRPLYTLPDSDATFALVDNDVSLAEYRLLDDPSVVVTVRPGSVEETGETVVIDGRERDVALVPVNGELVEAYRARLTTGGLFVNVGDLTDQRLLLVNQAEAQKQFGPRPSNFTDVLSAKEPGTNGKGVGRSMTNTVLVTLLVVAGQLVTSILGGYAFARIDFRGRGQLFLLYLGSVMVPFVVLIIPLFRLITTIGWNNNLAALIIPFIFTAYGTFLMRQFFVGIPKEIEEAALLDGASRWRILWQVMVPLARPAIASLATFGFLYAWNSFFWPLVVTNTATDDAQVLAVTLSTLGGRSSTDINLVFAGAVIAMTPPILVFLFAQRYFVESSSSSGLK
jgi:multiple sugar transport system permease protein